MTKDKLDMENKLEVNSSNASEGIIDIKIDGTYKTVTCRTSGNLKKGDKLPRYAEYALVFDNTSLHDILYLAAQSIIIDCNRLCKTPIKDGRGKQTGQNPISQHPLIKDFAHLSDCKDTPTKTVLDVAEFLATANKAVAKKVQITYRHLTNADMVAIGTTKELLKALGWIEEPSGNGMIKAETETSD